jgi:hypothetical protein
MLLGDMRVDSDDVQISASRRFRISVDHDSDCKAKLLYRAHFVFVFMSEAVAFGIGRKMRDWGLVIDNKHQTARRTTIWLSETLKKKWDFLTLFGVWNRQDNVRATMGTSDPPGNCTSRPLKVTVNALLSGATSNTNPASLV